MSGAIHPPRVKSCFVVSPIGSEGTDERRRADQALKHIFSKALEPLGYEVVRADKIAQPGMISIQVLQRIMDAASTSSKILLCRLADRIGRYR